MRRLVCRLLALVIVFAIPAAHARPALVLAAASLQESLTAAADAWARRGHPRPVLSFAASSALARQVAAGARADLFMSADAAWMDVVERQGLVVPGTRVDLLGNRLVLVSPRSSRLTVSLRPGVDLRRVLGGGRLAMADPGAVPAGKYGRAALTRLGAWGPVAPLVVRAENVRAALALVERGAAPLGIVYLTDARASPRVRIAGVFPQASHPPIVYPVARLRQGRQPREGEEFRRFLGSREGQAIFRRFGFSPR